MSLLASLSLILLLIVASGFAAWVGVFGVHARSTMRQLMRSRRTRRKERIMLEVMRQKIAGTTRSKTK